MLCAVILYCLFHDVTQLAVFARISQNSLFAMYVNFQHKFFACFKKFPFCKFVVNYAVDALWFTAFCSIIFSFLQTRLKYMAAIFFALVTEFLQLLNPALGTFDFFDILLYASIVFCFALFQKLTG